MTLRDFGAARENLIRDVWLGEISQRVDGREFDFLRGCETYKYSWGARDRQSAVRRRAP